MFNPFSPKVSHIEVEEVKKVIDGASDVVLLDVRTPMEFANGKISGSINIPVDEIQDKVEKVVSDKNKTIYVYCLSGSRSDHAVEIMIKLGYTQVSSLKSGLLAWRAKGFPTQ